MEKRCGMAGGVFVGTSGWNYKHWAGGRFYPGDLSQKDWFSFYARRFGTVEINSTFYRLPEAKTFRDWARKVPGDFVFAVKVSRFITHIKRLKEPEQSLKLFLSRAGLLRKKLGPVLFQLPPQMKFDRERLESLIACLRRRRNLRIVLEVRHESWLAQEVYDLLEDAGWTLCLADYPGLEREAPALGPFCYIRRHGTTALYGGCYSDEQLAQDAKFAAKLAGQGKNVYIYFNNDAEGYAVRNAKTLIRMIQPRYLARSAEN
ncbi:MAG: DUF72 domain-containing protein [Deltaproteobacteria bacterium]|nr:DUF72 domain-containing protein [Deltaproteobacteria bacterium]